MDLPIFSPYHVDDLCSLVNVLGSDQWSEDVVPTVAFNLRTVRKGNVTMKVWDVAVSKHPRFRCTAAADFNFLSGPAKVQRHVGPVLSRSRCYNVSYFFD